MEDWKDGRLHGVFAISHNIGDLLAVQAQNENISSTQLLAILIGLGGLLGLFICFTITRHPLEQLKINTEILSQVGGELKGSATSVSESSRTLSDATSSQAASLEESVATMEELTAMVKLNTENAHSASQIALGTEQTVMKGQKELEDLIKSIGSISEDSKKIHEITAVIDEIAFQTNLLALNAAVEAARAGEQGKGFSVVAEAVRGLAQRSSESAKNISTLINENVEKIERGNSQAVQSGQTLKDIVSSVKKVTELISGISEASGHQSQGITQMEIAMNQMDEITQSNAVSAEKTALAASDLSQHSSTLLNSVMNLKEVVHGRRD